MEKVKKVLQAILGYSGSSEDPNKMSMRFTGVVMGVIAQFAPVITLIMAKFVDLPANVTTDQFTSIVEPYVQILMVFVAVVLWVVGAIRAARQAYKAGGIKGFSL